MYILRNEDVPCITIHYVCVLVCVCIMSCGSVNKYQERSASYKVYGSWSTLTMEIVDESTSNAAQVVVVVVLVVAVVVGGSSMLSAII